MPRPQRPDRTSIAQHTVSTRLTDVELRALDERLVEQNARLRSQGLPPMVTRGVFLRSLLMRELGTPSEASMLPAKIRPTVVGSPTWERLTHTRAPEPVAPVVEPPAEDDDEMTRALTADLG